MPTVNGTIFFGQSIHYRLFLLPQVVIKVAFYLIRCLETQPLMGAVVVEVLDIFVIVHTLTFNMDYFLEENLYKENFAYGTLWTICRKNLLQQPFIIAHAVNDAADLYCIRLYNKEHYIAFYYQVSVAFSLQSDIPHKWTPLGHFGETTDFFYNQVIVSDCGLW